MIDCDKSKDFYQGKGKPLAQLRKERKMTQIELAKALKVERTTLSKWELGQAQITEANLRHVEAFFGEKVLIGCFRSKARESRNIKMLCKAIPPAEKRLLRTFHNVRDLLLKGYSVRDVLDVVFEYVSKDGAEKVLRKWEKIGFYHVPGGGCVDQGYFIWRLLPPEYEEAFKDELGSCKKDLHGKQGYTYFE